jgi:AraC-like DNA-binding protein
MLQIVDHTIKQKKSPLFWKTLVSYSIVLLVPILICSIYYFHSYNVVKERNQINQHLILTNYAKQLDSAFWDTITLGSHLQLNKYVIALAQHKSTIDSVPAMDRYYLKKDLAALQVANSLFQEINLYFPQSDYIVNSSSTFLKSLLPFMETRNDSLSHTSWDNILHQLQNSKMICYANDQENFITVARTLNGDLTTDSPSVLCIQLNKKNLLSRLQNDLLMDSPCSFALVSQTGPLLVVGENQIDFTALPYQDIFRMQTESSRYELPSGEKVIIEYYPLLIDGVSLISVTKEADYLAQTAPLLRIMILTFMCCALIGIIVIMHYSHRNYEPISRIMQLINSTDETIESDKNEYLFIMNTLNQRQQEIERQKTLLQNNYLQKILSGEVAVNQISEQAAAQFSLHFTFSAVCVATLSIEETGSFKDVDNAWDLTIFTIKNVFQELLNEVFAEHYFYISGTKISVLVNVQPSEQTDQLTVSPITKLENLTQQLVDYLWKYFQLSLRVGISSVNQCEQIPDAYLQANTALEYQKLFETDRICSFDSIPQKQLIGSLPLNTSEYVINLVTAGETSQIDEYFKIICKNVDKHELTWSDAKSCFYFFYQTTAKLQLYCQTHFDLQLEALSFLNEAYFTQSLPNALAQTRHAYLSACKELTEHSNSPSNMHWGTDICRFIHNNYFDANINLNSIAEYFHITPAYLSKKFREQYQQSVIDYLYEIRIANAVTLLQETDLRIVDIAQMVGFIDSNAFIRIFKKQKGITPGKYKEDKIITNDHT